MSPRDADRADWTEIANRWHRRAIAAEASAPLDVDRLALALRIVETERPPGAGAYPHVGPDVDAIARAVERAYASLGPLLPDGARRFTRAAEPVTRTGQDAVKPYPRGGQRIATVDVLAIETEARDDLMTIIAEHHPRIGVDQSDSTWLECDCAWDESKSGAAYWHEHLVEAVENKGRPTW